jgi:lipoprotein-anchoring transpeptidase ErfK/SrfK
LADPGKADAGTAVNNTDSGTTTYFGPAAAKSSGDKSTDQAAAPKAKSQPPLPPTLTASVDLARQTMSVSVNGEPRYSWPISSGVAQFPTPTGTFRAQWSSKMWYSRKYDMAPMPNAVFINGGVAVHGTYHTAALGRAASHGCIRLSTANARTFYNLVQRHGLARTLVSVHGRPNWRSESAIASRDRSRRDDDYAESNNNNAFWGNFWEAPSSSAYDPNFTRKRDRDRNKRNAQRHKKGGYASARSQDYKGYAEGN